MEDLNYFQRIKLRIMNKIFNWIWDKTINNEWLSVLNGIYGRRLLTDNYITTPEERGQLIYIKTVRNDSNVSGCTDELQTVEHILNQMYERRKQILSGRDGPLCQLCLGTNVEQYQDHFKCGDCNNEQLSLNGTKPEPEVKL